MERANVVEQVLLQHVGSIDKFSCIFYVPRYSQIDSWILILSRNGIKEFILKVKSKDYCDVPSTIFLLCQKLCLLELFNCALKVPPTFTGLRNLLVLQLRFCKFSEDDIAFLISESPLLEKLTLAGFSFSKCLNIHVPNLRYLEILGNFPDLSLGSSPLLTDVSIILHLPNDYSDYLEHHKTCSLIQFTGCLHGICKCKNGNSQDKRLASNPLQTSFPAQDNKCSASIMKEWDRPCHASPFDQLRRWTREAYSRLMQRFEFRERRSGRGGVSSDTKGCCCLLLLILYTRRTDPEALCR
ncbi:F-box/FBD/LRR-repeat protein isoform X1 [Cinnamomum micranthum f. kanehirae]|uniref:F-box/FBD/LRR-repeat protein isoform X1 n=1 Tax=Cinnamomum micranthum f. kanehirae TaxID=337451 RepID=A0A3S4NTM9_9MAGN|nr:F-box/FBD/LRR-repeat protein isoform X1 [Cinnamomum micranthum f. kanehirae]